MNYLYDFNHKKYRYITGNMKVGLNEDIIEK
jgi:hypothetical protein